MGSVYPFAVIVLLLTLSACDSNRSSELIALTKTPADAAVIARGIEVYRANYCGACHTLQVANTRGMFGPAHDHAATMATTYLALSAYNGSATTPAEYIRESIVSPDIFYTPGYEATNHHMPAFGHLPDADIEALVTLLLQP